MSQLVLDDQLDVQIILPELEPWITAVRLQSLRPGEHILDERVPEILLTLKTPTFVTIDHGFWNRRLCHPGYCILYFGLHADDQQQLPGLLQRLFRLPEFRTRAARMGKVARVTEELVTYWEAGKKKVLNLLDLD
jgi:hypothetical protein